MAAASNIAAACFSFDRSCCSWEYLAAIGRRFSGWGTGAPLCVEKSLMNEINDTVNLLKRIILDPNCTKMNLSTVKGYLGELLVKAKLEREGMTVEQHGNQS